MNNDYDVYRRAGWQAFAVVGAVLFTLPSVAFLIWTPLHPRAQVFFVLTAVVGVLCAAMLIYERYGSEYSEQREKP